MPLAESKQSEQGGAAWSPALREQEMEQGKVLDPIQQCRAHHRHQAHLCFEIRSWAACPCCCFFFLSFFKACSKNCVQY